ncbi:MAG: hypothetical protein WA231_18685 [Methylocella sp.]
MGFKETQGDWFSGAYDLEHMKEVPDHRVAGMVTYPLKEIPLATLVGVLYGADD